MYAIKEAVIAKEHAPYPLDAAIFFMDMRTFGKDFEHYYNRAKDEHGVRFIRSRIHSIDPAAGRRSAASGMRTKAATRRPKPSTWWSCPWAWR